MDFHLKSEIFCKNLSEQYVQGIQEFIKTEVINKISKLEKLNSADIDMTGFFDDFKKLSIL